jgi:hypothetical protein
MQLTKDDVRTFRVDDGQNHFSYIDAIVISKFLDVRKFYEDYKDDERKLQLEEYDIFSLWMDYVHKNKDENGYFIGESFISWLFSYCFKDGLK